METCVEFSVQSNFQVKNLKDEVLEKVVQKLTWRPLLTSYKTLNRCLGKTHSCVPLLYCSHRALHFWHFWSPKVWGVFSYIKKFSVTPAGCPIVQFSSDTIYLELASDPTSYGLSSTQLPPHPRFRHWL